MQHKRRHGCLTAWLIYLLLAYFIGAIIHFFPSDQMLENSTVVSSENVRLILGSIAILDIAFIVMLFKWVKLGFWGILSTSVILAILHIISGQGIVASFFVVLCLIILYALLRIKKGIRTGWENLE